MGFKLYSDSSVDRPMLACDVCGLKVFDFWTDKATGTPSHDGQLSDVTVHHAACTPPAGAVTMSLIDFLRLFVVQSRIGDLGSNSTMDKVSVEYPTGKGFSV
jgi:hypothetical protein